MIRLTFVQKLCIALIVIGLMIVGAGMMALVLTLCGLW